MRRFGLTVLTSILLAAARGPGAEISTRPELITPETETAIQRGLAALARAQQRNGAWNSQGAYGGIYPCAMTSLAGLALMAGGNTPSEGQYAEQVRKAVYYVLSCANRNGLISMLDQEQRPMYGHGFGMLFLTQAYGVEQDVELQRKIHAVVRRGIDLTARSQSQNGGWLYTPDSNGDEGSVTVTQIQALRAARNAGIKVPKSTIDRACEYLAKCAESDGGICYSIQSRGSRPPITAAACATLYNAGQYENPVALKALEYTKKHVTANRQAAFAGHDAYGLLYAAEAMFLCSSADWKTLFPVWRDNLVKTQSSDGNWGGGGVGNVYETSMRLLVLQLPYQYLPILHR